MVLFAAVAFVGLFPVTTGDAAGDPRLNISQLGFPGLAASAPAAMLAEIQAGPVTFTVAPGVYVNPLLGVADMTGAALGQRQLAIESSSVESDDASTEAIGRVSMYLDYVVQAGDTIASIADAHGIGRNYITWNNVDLDDPNRLSPGDQIIIPWIEGILHTVRANETVSDIARRYDAEVGDILEFAANDVPDPSLLKPDRYIFVPGGRIVPAARSIRPGPAPPPVQSGDWFWPSSEAGTLTSWFTAWHRLGIDIGLRIDTPILATRGGVVQAVNIDNRWSGYGVHVIIEHDNGYESTYAHLNSVSVSTGQLVQQGDVIGLSGNTGNSTGPHLHFEIRLWDVPQNPLELINAE